MAAASFAVIITKLGGVSCRVAVIILHTLRLDILPLCRDERNIHVVRVFSLVSRQYNYVNEIELFALLDMTGAARAATKKDCVVLNRSRVKITT